MSQRIRYILILFTITILIAGFSLVGCNTLLDRISSDADSPDFSNLPKEFSKVNEVYQFLSRDYVDKGKIDPEILSIAAVRGMIQEINDPYTHYLSQRDFEVQKRALEGSYEGIGTEVQLIDGQLVVVKPFPGSPAEDAGILSGDIVLKVDGIDLSGKTINESILLIRGKEGTTVTLEIQRAGNSAHLVVDVIRSVIQYSTVHWEILSDDIAYIRISNFAQTTDDDVIEALIQINSLEARSLIIDLRNNLGGLLEETVNVVSQFLGEGLVVYEINAHGERTDWHVNQDGLATQLPLVVLTNRFSASSSEVFVGAIQDYSRGTIVGTKTFGKGSVNIYRELSDKSGLFLTFGRWYTPNGRLIEGEGIEPDIHVDVSDESERDTTLEKAIDILRQRVNARIPSTVG